MQTKEIYIKVLKNASVGLSYCLAIFTRHLCKSNTLGSLVDFCSTKRRVMRKYECDKLLPIGTIYISVFDKRFSR